MIESGASEQPACTGRLVRYADVEVFEHPGGPTPYRAALACPVCGPVYREMECADEAAEWDRSRMVV